MRSAARDLLKFPDLLVEEVFGTAWHPSPWAWSDASVTDTAGYVPGIRARARIQVGADTGTVTAGALVIADEVPATTGTFSIEKTGWIGPDHLREQETMLLAAARAVTALGGDRRRGLGWVTITPVDPPWSADHLRTAVSLVGKGNGGG